MAARSPEVVEVDRTTETKALAMIQSKGTTLQIAKKCGLTAHQVSAIAGQHRLASCLRKRDQQARQQVPKVFRGYVDKGMTTKQIAAKFNRSISWTISSAQTYGLTADLWENNKRARRARGWARHNEAIQARRAKVRSLLAERHSITEIAQTLKVSNATVYKDRSIEQQNLDARLRAAGPFASRVLARSMLP